MRFKETQVVFSCSVVFTDVGLVGGSGSKRVLGKYARASGNADGAATFFRHI